MAVYIIFGVSGTGKTTIGNLLSKKLNIPFYDADDFHPETNVAKMRSGQPLTDEDRMPWLQELARNIKTWAERENSILACSALKEEYRKTLALGNSKEIRWIYLHQEMSIIEQRLQRRSNHFFKKEMLQSQFNDLEEPQYGLKVDVRKSPKEIVKFIIKSIKQ